MTTFQQQIQVEDVSGTDWVEFRFDYNPTNLALVCQICGNVWARMIVGRQPQVFSPVSHICRACGGGMLSNLHLEYRFFHIPDELLLREMEIFYATNGKAAQYSSSVYI